MAHQLGLVLNRAHGSARADAVENARLCGETTRRMLTSVFILSGMDCQSMIWFTSKGWRYVSQIRLSIGDSLRRSGRGERRKLQGHGAAGRRRPGVQLCYRDQRLPPDRWV